MTVRLAFRPHVAYALACLATACDHSSSHGNDPLTAPSTSASVPAPSASAALPAPEKAKPVLWTGAYTSSPGSLYVYDGGEWKGVHFRGDDASIGLGEGTLSLTIDPNATALRGTGGGPLGDVILSGALDAKTGELSFTVLRKDTADRGFTGTGVGHVREGTLTGTMRLSRGDAHVIREATFTLKPSP